MTDSFFRISKQNMNKPKYFLYARKSTEDDDKQIMSIEAQLFELREFARKENLQILEEFTESKSAKKPGRGEFNVMMSKVESMEGIGILAWHPDRLARNSIDGGRIIYAVDTSKIVSLRFPTFWFEPTPQGLFMLQVAFGQSKYYSDNLKQNVERGFRQKVRRGEWINKAPRGYVNNPKTRNIEPDPVISRVVVKAFEEYASGKHCLTSLARFFAEHDVVTRNGTPLSKCAVAGILSSRVYLGLLKHHGEWYEGTFAPILSRELFEAVQLMLKKRAKPRKSKKRHDFPFTGLFRCGECGSMITAQWATGRLGGRYRYYRCTKKAGTCAQGYLREDRLVSQIKERLVQIALPDDATAEMLRIVDMWEREENESSGSLLEQWRKEEREAQVKIDKLVGLYLDGDIPREHYLAKKDELLRTKIAFSQKMTTVRAGRKNWIEPLREWILDTKKATVLSSTDNFSDICDFVRKAGTNPVMRDKSISVSFSPPSEFAFAHKTETAFAHPLLPIARLRASTLSTNVLLCALDRNRTYI